jgi:signal transduction histidine kinase
MLKNPVSANEEARLKDLYDYKILDTPPEEDFDEIVRLASRIFNVPISLITLVDAHRQWFKSKIGIGENETNKNISFCAETIEQDDILVIQDASKDKRFRDNPFVTGNPDIRFYAGIPLVSPTGSKLGALCIIDRVPRNMTAGQSETLAVLGKQVVKLMELHKSNCQLRLITEQKELQRKELERVSQMQQRIISIMAHDVRNPLNSLKSLLQLIPDKQAGIAQQGMFLDMGITQLNSTLGLLDNLVEWGRLQMKGNDIGVREFYLNNLIKELEKELEIFASNKDIRLRNKVDTNLKISTNEDMLRFILCNLLSNAIKFTKKGFVSIDAVLSNESILIKVEDTGIGMPPAILELLFHGQKKILRKGTQNETGAGLGLSLVHEFIQKMNGSISAESIVDKGTSITFKLPLIKSVQAAKFPEE